ncbi:SSI family serine proteinase inhibitor [Actinomadura flavalba]|uniref:SSI family serine proteinase inhibitor n=1 Tax=Actinomadura flavalba TaxID=1120938 RepID=UPI00036C19DD|nr:SSI family serine proteinase inhibitor [Actinomadura flavalba]
MASPLASALAATALGGAALVLTPALPATAAPLPLTGTSLRLTLTFPEKTTSGTRQVRLYCEPPHGTHPAPLRACAELAASGGEFERRNEGVACTLQYDPVTAEARGTWRGRPVAFRQTYSNACAMHAVTGGVFAF